MTAILDLQCPPGFVETMKRALKWFRQSPALAGTSIARSNVWSCWPTMTSSASATRSMRSCLLGQRPRPGTQHGRSRKALSTRGPAVGDTHRRRDIDRVRSGDRARPDEGPGRPIVVHERSGLANQATSGEFIAKPETARYSYGRYLRTRLIQSVATGAHESAAISAYPVRVPRIAFILRRVSRKGWN